VTAAVVGIGRRVVAGLGTALVVVLGVAATGGLLTEDADLAMVLTGTWLAVVGLAALLVARRRRTYALPVVGAYALTTMVVGGVLLHTSTVDRVVDERVLTAAAPSPQAAGAAEGAGAAEAAMAVPDVRVVATGTFRGQAHPAVGTATVLERADGSRVLTLTGFATDPGPDLRVRLVPRAGADAGQGADLGALKGNRGDQQYDVPREAAVGAVVVWCRAFSVAFGEAALT
jgi:hypothetical protein